MAGRERTSTSPLDEVSKAIIEQLQQDGRRPYAAIGKAVGLSEAAVRQRVQRLLDAGVMQTVAVTDPLTVGFPRAAMIGIRCEGDSEAVADKLATSPDIDYVVLTAGSVAAGGSILEATGRQSATTTYSMKVGGTTRSYKTIVPVAPLPKSAPIIVVSPSDWRAALSPNGTESGVHPRNRFAGNGLPLCNIQVASASVNVIEPI